MGVPARSSAYGDFRQTEVAAFTTTTTQTNGSESHSYGAIDLRVGNCSRRNYTKNGLYEKYGTIPWRNPSNYTRAAAQMDYGEGSANRTLGSGTKVAIRGFINVSGGGDGFSIPGLYSGDFCVADWQFNESNRAAVECLLKLQGDKTSFGQQMLEAKRTHALITESFFKLVSALRSVKHGNFKLAAKHLGLSSSRGIAGNILEFQYGWRPLMADIYSNYKYFRDNKPTFPLLVADRTVRWGEGGKRLPNRYNLENKIADFAGTSTCKLYAKLSDSFLNNACSFDVANPLALGWELVPFSFVVDWAMPVGNFLEALNARVGLDFVGGYYAQRVESTVSGTINPGSAYSVAQPFMAECKRFSFERRRLSGFPAPIPYAKSPFSTEHALNSMALLRSLRK